MGLAALGAPACAQDKYGHYNQNATEFDDICATAAGGSKACGPIALLNSLVFLQNTYPAFDNKLVGPDPHATALALSQMMGCSACNGTDTAKFFEGKRQYLEARAPGQIASLKFTDPTALTLKQEVQHGEDVELYLGFYDADGHPTNDGHYVTLYDVGDGTLSFVDPGGLAGADGGTIDGATNETVNFMLSPKFNQLILSGYEGLPPGTQAHVDFAFSESPVPEPAAWAMMIAGFGLVGFRARKRRSRFLAA